MKAVILVAGIGSRIRPLTDNNHKTLLKVGGGKPILQRMLENIQAVGIDEVAFITGYRADDIQNFVKENFPNLKTTFIHNDKYLDTNTGYSVLLARDFVGNDTFLKFDGDVVFEKAVLEKLIENPFENCLCIDTNINLEAEEVKVTLDDKGQVLEVGKKLDPHKASGESIGIEKLGPEGGKVFFDELEKLMQDTANWKEYYDDTYTTLVEKGIPFGAADITGLNWVEIDTHEDYAKANDLFS